MSGRERREGERGNLRRDFFLKKSELFLEDFSHHLFLLNSVIGTVFEGDVRVFRIDSLETTND